jgi:hypothetical protein
MKMKVNDNCTITNKVTLGDIDFTDDDCCFDLDYCFVYDGQAFEDMGDGSFRAILAVNDYDYVEDEALLMDLVVVRA